MHDYKVFYLRANLDGDVATLIRVVFECVSRRPLVLSNCLRDTHSNRTGYHCSKLVREFAIELRIEIHYLPPYSPNLNPIERLWKIMHEEVTYNRYYQKFSDFTEAIQHFFRHIGKKKSLLADRITDNFQKLEPPNFAF